MKAPPFLIVVVCFASIALADDFKTIDGKEYKNVTVSRVEPDGITVKNTKAGVIVKLYFTELPKDVQQRFNYDPELQQKEDDLVERIREAKHEPVGSTRHPIIGSQRRELPSLQSSLSDVRREKADVKQQLEQLQH